jgi:hypothetical protein
MNRVVHRSTATGHWKNLENQKVFAISLLLIHEQALVKAFEKEHRIESQKDWYQVTNVTFRKFGGAGVLANYQFSIYSMLKVTSLPSASHNLVHFKALYPELVWYPWFFKRSSSKFWKSETASLVCLYSIRSPSSHIKEYIKWLEQELNITKREDWYEVDFRTLRHNRGFDRAVKHKGILQLLKVFHLRLSFLSNLVFLFFVFNVDYFIST